MRKIHIILGGLLTIVLLLSGTIIVRAQQTENQLKYNQDEIVNDVIERLEASNLIVLGANIVTDKSLDSHSLENAFEIMIRSNTENLSLKHEDVLSMHEVIREVQLAVQRGLDIDAWRLKIINMSNEIVLALSEPVTKKDFSGGPFGRPSQLDDLVVRKNLLVLMAGDESTNNVQVTRDIDGMQKIKLNITIDNLSSIRDRVDKIISTSQERAIDINKIGGSVSVIQIEIQIQNGEQLLVYVDDLQFGRTTYWRADVIMPDQPRILNQVQ